jgi:hypothetical protein
MDIVAKNNKILLKHDTLCDFTIERIEDTIVLQEHIKIMRLGLISAKWLLECFEVIVDKHYSQEQTLVHRDKTVLQILNESGYIYIIGTNTRFNMKKEVATKLLESLRALLATE